MEVTISRTVGDSLHTGRSFGPSATCLPSYGLALIRPFAAESACPRLARRINDIVNQVASIHLAEQTEKFAHLLEVLGQAYHPVHYIAFHTTDYALAPNTRLVDSQAQHTLHKALSTIFLRDSTTPYCRPLPRRPR